MVHWTFTGGDVVQTLVFVIAGLYFLFNLRTEIKVLEVNQKNLKETQQSSLAEIKESLEKIQDKLDAGADKLWERHINSVSGHVKKGARHGNY